MEAAGGGPPFVCRDCGFSFKRLANLRVHEKKHTGEAEVFTCELCPGIEFGRVYELRRHMVVTHGAPGATPSIQKHVCSECGSEFRRADALKRHLRRSEIVPCRERKGIPASGSPVKPRRTANGAIKRTMSLARTAPFEHGPSFGSSTESFAREGSELSFHSSGEAAVFEGGAPSYDFGLLASAAAIAETPYGRPGFEDPTLPVPPPRNDSPYVDGASVRWNPETVPATPATPQPPGPLTPATLEMMGYITHDQAVGAGAAIAGPVQSAIPGDAAAPLPDQEDDGPSEVPYPILVKALLPPQPIPAPLVSLTTLYPSIPQALLPPWPIMSYLLEGFFEFDFLRTPCLHPPTFYDDVVTGRADPNVLLAVMLNGRRMANSEIGLHQVSLAGGGWEHVFAPDGAWPALLKDECVARANAEARALREAPPPELDTVDPDPALLARLSALATFAQICRHGLSAMGAVGEAVAMTDFWAETFRLLRFGELPGDDSYSSPHDLPEFIRHEVRSRQCAAHMIADAALSDALGVLPVLVDGRRVVMDDSGRFNVPWGNMAITAGPNILFESLPAARTPPHVWAGILNAERTIELDEPPYEVRTSLLRLFEGLRWPRLGIAHALICMPPFDPRRAQWARVAGRGALRNGYIWMQAGLTPLWALFVRCKAFFVQRGWKLHSPPDGHEEDEVEGRRMRGELLAGISEYFRELHPKIGKLIAKADGKGLKDLTEREWGRQWRTTLPNAIVIMFTHLLILNSPSDIFDRVIVDEGWPYSPQFVEAEALAMTVSKICRSSMRVEPPEGPARPGELEEDRQRRYRLRREDEMKRISPVWGLVALRACWVHVVAIRKFRALLKQHSGDAELIQLALGTVRNLIEDVDGVLEGLGSTGSSFKQIHSAYNVVRDLVERDIMTLVDPNHPESPEAVWIGPSPEEMRKLRFNIESSSTFTN